MLIAVDSTRQKELDADPKAIQQLELAGQSKILQILVMKLLN